MKKSTIYSQLANNVEVPLDDHALADLRWWVGSLSLANGRPIQNSLPYLVFQSDASNTGWGAASNGVATRGTWKRKQTSLTVSLHISCKELFTASYAGKAFTKTLQNVHVLIQIDNTTIAYINKIGGGGQKVPTRSLCKTSVEVVSP